MERAGRNHDKGVGARTRVTSAAPSCSAAENCKTLAAATGAVSDSSSKLTVAGNSMVTFVPVHQALIKVSKRCGRARLRSNRQPLPRGAQFTLAQGANSPGPRPRRHFRAGQASKPTPPTNSGEQTTRESRFSASKAKQRPGQLEKAQPITRESMVQWLKQRNEPVDQISIELMEDCRLIEQILIRFWESLQQAALSTVADKVLVMPRLSAPVSTALIAHIRECADATDVLGSDVFLTVYGAEDLAPRLCIRLKKGAAGASARQEQTEDDPFWSDDEQDFLDPRFAALLQASREEQASDELPVNAEETPLSSGLNSVDTGDGNDSTRRGPEFASDECMLAETRSWVQHVIVDAAVCPFMMSSERGGLPAGGVRYAISHATNAEQVYLEFWKEVALLRETSAKEIATTLLILPAMLSGAEAFDAMSLPLTSALETLQLDSFIQLVFFHPKYAFRDGRDRISVQDDQGGQAANYVRRSPYPMINILRTEQVQRGQRGIPTELVYRRNESLMRGIGAEKLAQMLRQRSWQSMRDLVGENRPYADLEEAVRRLREQFIATSEPTDHGGASTPS